jgi:hypothetical protein
MTRLRPSRTGGFAVEIKTTVSTHAAVACAGALEGWLGGPGEGSLFIGKQWVSMVIFHGWMKRGEGLTATLSLLAGFVSVKGRERE